MKTWNEVVEGYRERWIKIFSHGVEGFSEQACREIVIAMSNPKTGEWIEEDEYGDLLVCSECGFANDYKDDYCPSCKARMKGDTTE